MNDPLSFQVTVTRCRGCPHGDRYSRECEAPQTQEKSFADRRWIYNSNIQALTATGSYACPMLKQMKQEEK